MSKTKVGSTGYRLLWGHHSLEKRGYRCWWYLRGRNFFHFSGYVLTGSLGIGFDADDEDGTVHLSTGLFSLYISSDCWRRSDHMWSVPRVVCHLETGMRRSRCTDQQIIAILAEQERRGPFRD